MQLGRSRRQRRQRNLGLPPRPNRGLQCPSGCTREPALRGSSERRMRPHSKWVADARPAVCGPRWQLQCLHGGKYVISAVWQAQRGELSDLIHHRAHPSKRLAPRGPKQPLPYGPLLPPSLPRAPVRLARYGEAPGRADCGRAGRERAAAGSTAAVQQIPTPPNLACACCALRMQACHTRPYEALSPSSAAGLPAGAQPGAAGAGCAAGHRRRGFGRLCCAGPRGGRGWAAHRAGPAAAGRACALQPDSEAVQCECGSGSGVCAAG